MQPCNELDRLKMRMCNEVEQNADTRLRHYGSPVANRQGLAAPQANDLKSGERTKVGERSLW